MKRPYQTGPAYISCDRAFLVDKLESYSRNGWAKTKWMEFAEELLDQHFALLLYEDRPAHWRHFRITRVGNPLQLVVGLPYGDGKPPVAVHNCDIVVHRGGTTQAEALAAVLAAYAPDVDSLDYFEVVE